MSDAPVLSGVQSVADLESAGDYEKKHVPWISVTADGDRARVVVETGHYVPHPNQPDHYFQWIELYAGGAPIARADLSPQATEPSVTFLVALDPGTVLRALAYCNLHGVWAAETTL